MWSISNSNLTHEVKTKKKATSFQPNLYFCIVFKYVSPAEKAFWQYTKADLKKIAVLEQILKKFLRFSNPWVPQYMNLNWSLKLLHLQMLQAQKSQISSNLGFVFWEKKSSNTFFYGFSGIFFIKLLPLGMCNLPKFQIKFKKGTFKHIIP